MSCPMSSSLDYSPGSTRPDPWPAGMRSPWVTAVDCAVGRFRNCDQRVRSRSTGSMLALSRKQTSIQSSESLRFRPRPRERIATIRLANGNWRWYWTPRSQLVHRISFAGNVSAHARRVDKAERKTRCKVTADSKDSIGCADWFLALRRLEAPCRKLALNQVAGELLIDAQLVVVHGNQCPRSD